MAATETAGSQTQYQMQTMYTGKMPAHATVPIFSIRPLQSRYLQ